MTRPYIEPQPNETCRIVHTPAYGTFLGILRRIESGNIAPADAETQLKTILQKYPWHFEAAWRLSSFYMSTREVRKACEVRFHACQRLMELLPNDDETEHMPLDFEKKENHYPLFLLNASAIDHFLIGEFELSAALMETLLDFDEEDHLNCSPTLAWCYVALNESEMFEFVLPDLDDKSPEKALALMWAELRFQNRLPAEMAVDFKKRFPVVFREFVLDEHPLTEAYMADFESENPAPESRARLLWLRTEHLWQRFPELPAALKKYE